MKSARPFLTLVVLLVATASFGQQSFMDEPGIPAFTTAFPVEHGFINLANGNLHIEIPIATYPQRGNIKALHARLVYDSRFWTIRTDPVTLAQSWTQSLPLVGVSVGGGFRLITDGEAGNADSDRGVSVQCGCESFGTGCTPRFKTTYSNYFYQEPNGTKHRLPNTFKLINKYSSCVGPASNPDGTAYAMDNSGYKFVVINYTHMTVYAPDGSQVFPVLQDTNGNFYSTSASQNFFTDVVDTLGRTPVVTTFSGNQTFVDYLCPAGCNPANGDRARVTITSSASASSCTTQFNQASVNEATVACGGSQSIVLPDGSSYQLEFDSYGQITSITLPTGGQITYGYSNFTEPSGNVNRWVTSMVRDGQSWSFTPVNQACSVPPCTIQVTVTTPPYNDGTITASDSRVYLFTVTGGYGGGAWNTQTQYFRGAAAGAPVLTKTTDYGSPGACPSSAGIGITPVVIRETLTWPSGSGTLSKKVEYCYDNYSNVTAAKEWDYQPNGNFAAAPDRETDNVYRTDPTIDANFINANLIRLLKTSTTLNSAGTQVAQSSFGYDETAFQPSAISTHHVTPATSLGNQTSTTKWLNTTGGSVTSTTKWFDTGEVYQSIDPLLHTTTLSYDSAFSGAYLTKSCNALSPAQCSYNGYDFNTGLRTSTTDINGSQAGDPAHTTNYTFDALPRPLCTNLPDGGQTCLSYPDANHVSRNQIITASLPPDLSTTIFDGLGRVTQTQHTLPACISKVDTTYDPVGAPLTVSNPYCTTADSTYGVAQSFHDALGRTVKTIKQDGSISTVAYSVGNATTANGTCVTSTDEAGNQRRSCHNGFGELVEVDEPGGPDPGTQATASVTISGAINSVWIAPGSPHLAATGTALASVTMSDGSSHDFYFDTNQHLCQMSWFSGSGWYDQDLTSMTEAGLPLAGSSVAAAVLSGVIHVFYQGANLHIYDMNWTGSVWQNLDMTALTGASAMSGTKMSTVLTGNAYSPMMFYEGTNQHLYTLYWGGSAWQNADLNALSGATTLMAAKGSIGSVMFSGNTVVYVFYVGTNQHLIAVLLSGSTWLTGDVTNASGAALAVSGSALTTVATGTTIDLMNFYEGSNQHIYSIYWNGSAGAWQALDFTAFSGATNVAAVQTALTNLIGPSIFYFGSNQHLDDIYWNGSAYVNADVTSLANTTVVAASGSFISSHGTAGPNTYNLFFEGGNQHIYHTYYNPGAPGWFNEDPLVAASNFVVDSGTVSLTVPNGSSNFTATVCYGVSTNPICAGQPANASPGAIANALAAVLNGAGSPVNATPAGTTLNLTWRTPGFVTTTVAAMTSSSDNPSLFPVGSFTSTSATFSGGVTPGSQSLASPLITLYRYDGLGNLICVEQQGSVTGTGCSSSPASDATSPWRVRRFTYDSLSRLLTAKNPEAGQTSYQYDNDSNVVTKTDARGVTINYSPSGSPIDALHRVTQTTYSDGTPSVTYQYDTGCCGVTPENPAGRMTAAFSGNTELVFSYDPMGRIKTQWDCPPSGTARGFCYVISAAYDEIGNVTSLTYPDNRVVTSAYNAAGHFLRTDLASFNGTAVNFNYYTVPQSTAAANWGYWPIGAMNRGTFGNTVVETTGYNNRLQVSSIADSIGGTAFFSKSYGFVDAFGHNNGKILSIADTLSTTRNQSFTYDSLNRILTGAQADNAFNLTYSYDAWGNMRESGTSSFQPLFDINNRMTPSAGCTPNLVSYCYDAAGDLLMDNHNHVYAYDGEARIKTVDGAASAYTYNPLGNRVRKDAGSTSTEYFFFGGNVIAELNPATTAWTDYIGYGKRVAKDTSNNGTGAQYYHGDHLGSTRIMTDATGTKIQDCTFNPFGEQVICLPDNASNHYRFTGKEHDNESGLDDFGARYFSSSMGRWATPDWSARPVTVPYANFGDPQSLNLYLYVRNDPVSNADADGHIDDNADPDHPIVKTKSQDLGNGLTLTQTITITTTFNKDGSADVNQTTTSTVTKTDPNTGEKKQIGEALVQKDKLAHIDRDTEGRIIVDGKVAPRTAGDTIESVAKTIAAAKDPAGALIELGGHEAGRLVDYSRSQEGEARWDRFWSIDPGYLNKDGKWVTCQGGCPEHPKDAAPR